MLVSSAYYELALYETTVRMKRLSHAAYPRGAKYLLTILECKVWPVDKLLNSNHQPIPLVYKDEVCQSSRQ